jgi:lipopolysaccharide heptosyltransferase II
MTDDRSAGSPRILVVGVDWMGDVIFSTPLLRALRRAHPGAHIAYSTARRCVDVLRGCAYVDRVVAFDEAPFLSGAAEQARFAAEIRRGRFDTALFLHRSATRAFLALAGGVRRRIGYGGWKRAWLLTRTVPPPAEPVHRVDHYLGVLEGAGARPAGREVELSVTPEGRRAWGELRAACEPLRRGPYAVLHPGGNWALKRWPVEHFARLVRYFEGRGVATAVCGTPQERPLADALVAASPQGSAVSLSGRTTVESLAALMSESFCVVSNDSGPLHLGAAVRAPLVALFGPTRSDRTGPLSFGPVCVIERRVGCELPCTFGSCHHRVCLEGLDPDEVIGRIDAFLSNLPEKAA